LHFSISVNDIGKCNVEIKFMSNIDFELEKYFEIRSEGKEKLL
jgi:hypothetical protein